MVDSLGEGEVAVVVPVLFNPIAKGRDWGVPSYRTRRERWEMRIRDRWSCFGFWDVVLHFKVQELAQCSGMGWH